MTIGERIKKKREELQLSQRDLAEKMNYSNHSTIGKIERGQVDVSQTRIVQFAEVLHTDVSYLMGWEEEIENAPHKMAERHFEMIIDEDLNEIFDDFKILDVAQKKIVKDLIHSLAKQKKEA